MRRLFLILVACAPSFAATLSALAQCDGVLYFGTTGLASGGGEINYAYCASSDASASAEALSATPSLNVSASGNAQGQATLYALYELTVMGGIGDGFAEPQLSAAGSFSDPQYPQNFGYATELLSGNSGSCEAIAGAGNPYQDSCTPTSVSFVFGIPQTLNLSLYAGAASGLGYENSASTGGVGFVFYNVNGQLLNDVTYTFTPAPEPGMFPLLAAMFCAALIARRQLRKSFPSR
jgi:hypothetical protein